MYVLTELVMKILFHYFDNFKHDFIFEKQKWKTKIVSSNSVAIYHEKRITQSTIVLSFEMLLGKD